MGLNVSYFGIGMENIDVLAWIGVYRLVLHPEMEYTNIFPQWDLGNHFFALFLKIEV